MPVIDKRVDEYIHKAEPFAKPILQHLRGLIHDACPEVKETIKWGFPNFEYSGKVMCSMAAFKQHCAFNFWKASLMKDPDQLLTVTDRKSMGHLGRITSVKDLPSPKILKKYIQEAAALNAAGVKAPAKPKTKTGTVEVPDFILKAINKNKKAKAAFEAFSPSHKKEYIEWIAEAKTEPTREKRIATMLLWLGEGKSRNWQYAKK